MNLVMGEGLVSLVWFGLVVWVNWPWVVGGQRTRTGDFMPFLSAASTDFQLLRKAQMVKTTK